MSTIRFPSPSQKNRRSRISEIWTIGGAEENDGRPPGCTSKKQRGHALEPDEFERECSAPQQGYSKAFLWKTTKKYAEKVGMEGMRNARRVYGAQDNPAVLLQIKAVIAGVGFFRPPDIFPAALPVAASWMILPWPLRRCRVRYFK